MVISMSKRGLSDIITNILIILIVLVAVGIVWTFVRPLISSAGPSVSSSIGTYATQLAVVPQGVFINETNKTFRIIVQRKTGSSDGVSITKIKIILTDIARRSATFECDITGSFRELETQACPGPSSTYDYSSSGLGQIASISVAPIIISNGQQTVGSVSDLFDVGTGTIQTGTGGQPPAQSCTPFANQTCSFGAGYPGSQQCLANGTGYGACVNTTSLRCGDSIITAPPESCDDGNIAPGDGCSASCGVESGWSCQGTPSSCLNIQVTSPLGGQTFDKVHVRYWFDLNFTILGSPTSCQYTTFNGSNVSLGASCLNQARKVFLNSSSAGCTYNLTNFTDLTHQNIINCPAVQRTLTVGANKGANFFFNTTTFSVRHCPGDINRDGFVNTSDLAYITARFGQNCSLNYSAMVPNYCPGDMNGDGIINSGDTISGQASWLIAYAAAGLQGACQVPGLCGNSQINSGEGCEVGSAAVACNYSSGLGWVYPGTRTCNLGYCVYNDCSTTMFCGDGVQNGNEECDYPRPGVSPTCDPDCYLM